MLLHYNAPVLLYMGLLSILWRQQTHPSIAGRRVLPAFLAPFILKEATVAGGNTLGLNFSCTLSLAPLCHPG